MTETPTTAHDRLRAERVERYAADLVSGQTFRWIEASQRSRGSYYGAGPLGHRPYADTLAALGRFASQSDWHAYVAHRLVQGLPLYNTEAEFLAKLACNFVAVVVNGYDDVVGRSGPNPGRLSSYQRETTLRDALNLHLLWCEIAIKVDTSTTSGPGWCAQALIERENVTVYQHVFPNIHAEQKRCEEIAARYHR